MKDKDWRKRVTLKPGLSGRGWYSIVDDKILPYCFTQLGAIHSAKKRIKLLEKGFTFV